MYNGSTVHVVETDAVIRELRRIRRTRERLPDRTESAVRSARDAGVPIAQIAREVGMTRDGIHKLLRRLEAEQDS
jgi:DNA-directed RNA polymerase specialized sigma24 family protein